MLKLRLLVSESRSIILLCATTFLYFVALHIYSPLLPVYAQSLGASLSMVGLVVAAYSIPQFICRIPLGLWSDKTGRHKPFAIGGMLIVLVGSIGLGFAPDPWSVFLSRFVVGIGAAMWAIITVYFVSFYSSNRANYAVAVINFVSSAGMIIASLLGGIITEEWGIRYTFYLAALLGLLALITVSFTRESNNVRSESISWSSFTGIARRPLLIIVSVMGILLNFVLFMGVYGFIPVYAHSIGASATEIGVITMSTMIAATVGPWIMFYFVSRKGYRFTIIISSILIGIASILVPLTNEVIVLGAVQIMNGLGKGILSTTLMALSIQGISPQQRSTVMGFYQAAYALGMLSGPIVSGFLADQYGLAIIFYIGGSLCLVITGLAFIRAIPSLTSRREITIAD